MMRFSKSRHGKQALSVGRIMQTWYDCLDIAMNQNQLQLQDLYNFDEGPERNTA